MKNVLVISGHPDLKISVANKTILDEISARLPQAEIRKLDELYPDYKFDIKAEQAALEKADVVIFAYPMHWFGVPGLLKLYIDKVMEHGWAYGSTGNALKGKKLLVSVTTGAPEIAYAEDGVMGNTIEDFTCPVAKFAGMCKLDLMKILYVCGILYVPGVTTDEQKAALVDKSKKYADELIAFVESL